MPSRLLADEGEQLIDPVREGVAVEHDRASELGAAAALGRVGQQAIDQLVQLLGGAVESHRIAEALGDSRHLIAQHEGSAGQRIVDAVGDVAVLAHVLPMVVQDDARGAVNLTQGELGTCSPMTREVSISPSQLAPQIARSRSVGSRSRAIGRVRCASWLHRPARARAPRGGPGT